MNLQIIVIFSIVVNILQGAVINTSAINLQNKINLNNFEIVNSNEEFSNYANNFTKPEVEKYLRDFFKDDDFNVTEENLNSWKSIISDAFLTTPQLLKKYGYPSEIHTVQTADDYILELHRIPNPGGIPVYLQHGVLDSSGGWVIMGPNKALAYILADRGYDVWMGNSRGNRYSKNHVYLSTKSSKFWDFSFHEMAIFDLPSVIDFILEKTNHKKIHYIGHSQGTTIFFVMCHLRPGYCDKIISMNALSPIAYLNNVKSPLVRIMSTFYDSLNVVSKIFGIREVLPNNEIFSMAGQLLCKQQAITQSLCTNILFLFTGYDSQQLNKTMLPAIFGHIPAGASVKQLLHFAQILRSGKFRMYDYGYVKNFLTYGKLSPPLYDLSKVTAPVAVHYSINDWMANPKDVDKLEEQLPNIIDRRIVPLPKFNHMDFLFAIDAKSLLYNEVVRVIVKHEN